MNDSPPEKLITPNPKFAHTAMAPAAQTPIRANPIETRILSLERQTMMIQRKLNRPKIQTFLYSIAQKKTYLIPIVPTDLDFQGRGTLIY
ncbi:hypothetical protein [Coxiella endosymbiont of Ornithodoros maritimus]|uniref:hypothetical protein n=1 Tax=Coxiella endosymbiont of Ornithodoros maritimus TaxID=1656172 RepID=UPI00226469A4|nr:hypothetical protein [Coxiella endosymbiont of Ornithodoros maritimus]